MILCSWVMLVVGVLATQQPLQIHSISTQSSSMVGSNEGGTNIYIKGLGFDKDVENNQVFIGPYPCIIPAEGVTDVTLNCETTKAIYGGTNLEVTVMKGGQIETAPQKYSYSSGHTPIIHDVYPSTTIPGTRLNFYSVHRINNKGDGDRDMGDFKGVYLGQDQCNMFDIDQQTMSWSSYSRLKCDQSNTQEAGRYTVKEHVNAGYSWSNHFMRRTHTNNSYYEHTVLPGINSISPSSGYVYGNQLTINGIGFPTDKTRASVSVDGVSCLVSSSTSSQIICDLEEKTTQSKKVEMENASSTQSFPYVGGSGLKYTRYDIAHLSPRTSRGLKTAVDTSSIHMGVRQSGFRYELQTPNLFEAYYGQVFKGYFYAPVSGEYTFRGQGDDSFDLYMSDEYGSTTLNPTPVISASSSTGSDSNYYISNYSTALGEPRYLEGNQYYYMELYHVNNGGDGYLKVTAEVPNSDYSLEWQTHEVNQFETSFINDPEIRRYTLDGATNGTFKLYLLRMDPQTLQIHYNVQAILSYDATADQFKSALLKFDLYHGYTLTVEKTIEGTARVWTVSIEEMRSKYDDLEYELDDLEGYAYWEEIQVQPHCPLLSGTFTLQIGGVDVKVNGNKNIPYNVDAEALKSGLRSSINGFGLVDVYRRGQPRLSAQWIISYIKYNGDVPDLVFDIFGLRGGKEGTLPSISFHETRKHSPNLFFSPVDENFLFHAVTQPHVIVNVNGLDSVCLGTCAYQFLNTVPQVQTESVAGSTLSLTVSDPNAANYPLTDLTVTLNGQPCTSLTGTFASFDCTLPVNTDQTPIITAGNHHTKIVVKDKGIIQTSSSPIAKSLTITSLSQASGSANGGYDLEINGQGFPLSSPEITMCSVSPTVKSTSNIKTIIRVPQCSEGSSTIEYKHNGQTATFSFTYTPVTTLLQITSISPTSASPALKGVMEIVGEGFGSDLSKVDVHLANASGKVYEMRILTLNNTYIKCGIPGGMPGNFQVQVYVEGVGNVPAQPSTANDFIYELALTSVSPTTGAYHGGTLITITGRNFAPILQQNLMHMGNELNWLCDIESLSETQIKCRTPKYHQDWGNRSTQNLVLNNRLVVDSTCDSDCSFTYDDKEQSINITKLSKSSAQPSSSITITGNNIQAGVQIVLQNRINNEKTLASVSAFTSTSIDFVLPNVQAGPYDIRARLDPKGQSNSMVLKVLSSFDQNSLDFSTEGGEVAITGKGLPSQWPSSLFSLSVKKNGLSINSEVASASAGQLVVKLPSGSDSFVITLKTPNSETHKLTATQKASATPSLTLMSPNPLSAGTSNFITLNRTSHASMNPVSIQIYSTVSNNVVKTVTHSQSGTELTFIETLPAGRYGLRVTYQGLGYGHVDSNLLMEPSAPFTTMSTTSSFVGGTLKVTGNDISSQAVIRVGGMVSSIKSLSPTQAQFHIPPLITQEVISTYTDLQKKQKMVPMSLISDGAGASKVNDGQQNSYYSSNSNDCFVGLDMGEGRRVKIHRIRYFPNTNWVIASDYIRGATVEASNDNTNYDLLGTVDETVHSGWNSIIFTVATPYRYIRIKHNTASKCQLAEIEVYGVLFSDAVVSNISSHTLSPVFDDGHNTYSFTNAIQYREDKTPIIDDVSPSTGDVFGGYDITLTGSYLDIGTAKITIDGIDCTVKSSTSSQIVCQVGSRIALPESKSFQVEVDGNKAIIRSDFMYVLRWSDIRTWGTDLFPVAGDLIHVPKGMTLFVDQTTPVVEAIVVEGTLYFSDEKDMEIHAGTITVNKGQFRAGTEKNPYQHELKFVMYGGYYGKQLPILGNKGIFCIDCKFSMHGQKRTKTWTTLSTTLSSGSSTLIVQDTVDWRPGEKIVVASTSTSYWQAEERQIASVNGNTITVTQPFNKRHVGAEEYFGAVKFEVRAEVGLLTRNIKMTGDAEHTIKEEYGSHLMMMGKAEDGMVSHVAYTQFFHCGQPRIVGRYCIHFHMNGDVPDSYVVGNAVHDSFARILTLHGVHYLYVEGNVGYKVRGHNFFIEDGIETQNVLENNLAIASLKTFKMMQTDISVASYWVTNPTNHIRYNHAAGGDFYGFWYQIKPRPDGPSRKADVCPQGNPLGESHHNVAHSYIRFGLRIFVLLSRQKPCRGISGSNPSITSVFHDYVVYKNRESGILAEQTGDMVFRDCIAADNSHAGIQFFTNMAANRAVIVEDMTVIGSSSINGAGTGSKGIIAPHKTSNRWKMSGVSFYNFGGSQVPFQTCSGCNGGTFNNIGYTYEMQKISYTNVTGKKLSMTGKRKEILMDLDGTFSVDFDANNRSSAKIITYYRHLAKEPECVRPLNQGVWENTLACETSFQMKQVRFYGLGYYIKGAPMKIQEIDDIEEQVPLNTNNYTAIYSTMGGAEPKVIPQTYSLFFVPGRIYNIWWHTGIDFNDLFINVGSFNDPNQPAIIFKFNYTLHRELFDVRDHNSFTKQVGDPLDNETCKMGQYMHSNDPSNRSLILCASGKGKSTNFIHAKAIYCRYLCPQPLDEDYEKEQFIRLWSNSSQWPNNTIPMAGDNVTVPGPWTLLMDIDPEPIQFFQINGDLYLPNTNPDLHLIVNTIWIRSGSLRIGSEEQPHEGNVIIEIHGYQNDPGYVFHPTIVGNKEFIVSGKLHLYGKIPETVWTKMTAFAYPGDTQIEVMSAAGWTVGDELVIGPSFSSSSQHEKVTITNISSNTVFFTPPLRYKHYGDPSITIQNEYGELDTRTPVGILTRNIKVLPGNDSGWGYRLMGVGYNDGNKLRTGNLILSGVEFIDGGQYNTHRTALQLLNMIGSAQNIITGSSFFNCKTICIDIQNARNLKITNNVFYKGKGSHVRALSITNYEFNSNLMIDAKSGRGLVACYVSYQQIDQVRDLVSVRNNVCAGSAGHGFALGYLPCSRMYKNPFVNNTVGSAVIGFIFTKVSSSCQVAEGVRAYSTYIGQIASSGGTSVLRLRNFIIADSGRAATLRFGIPGRHQRDLTAYFDDSFITAISRPSCTECYGGGANDCSGNYAVKLLAVTVNGESLPGQSGTKYDTICKEEQFDCKAFLTNITFENYNQRYGELPQCSSNVVFKSHPIAHALTGSHHLHQTRCNNCSIQATAYFDRPDPSQFGWFGGCGDFLCTGKNNYLIQDWDGLFMGQKGIFIANNSVIGENTPDCTYIRSINGHFCTRDDFTVLQYESIAPDFNTRIMWPVFLRYDGGLYTTLTNGWRQWEWQGSQPMNRRLGRFISIVELSKIYNMTFNSQPPSDMVLQFQRRTANGNNDDFIMVKLHYPRPNSIRIQVRGNTIKPISLLDNNGEDPIVNTTCGSNKFFWQNYTVHFVITGAKNCLVRVSLTNTIQLTARFAMPISEFYNIGGQTLFIDRMCAVLGVRDTSRLKVVGIYNGSVKVVAVLEEQIQPEDDAENYTLEEKISELQGVHDYMLELYMSGALNSNLAQVGFGDLTLFQTSFYTLPENYDKDNSKGNTPLNIDTKSGIFLIVGITLGSIVLVAVAVAGGIQYGKIRARRSKLLDQQTNQREIIQLEQISEDLGKQVKSQKYFMEEA